LQTETRGFKPLGEVGNIVHAEFDLGFDGHGQQ
jgi:hypothetical protein